MGKSATSFSFAQQLATVVAFEICLNSTLITASCSYRQTSKTGSIQSPGYPSNYPPNITCQWTVSVYSNAISRIELTFSSFDLEERDVNTGRCIDYVVVYKGLTEITPLLCGSVRPDTVTINRKAFLVKFVSVGNVTGRGFKAEYNAYEEEDETYMSSQATAGIVAAIFCGLIFLGIAVLRCAVVLKCCSETPSRRELVGTNETADSGNYNLDCPPSYRTVMEHPERFPTPTTSRASSPHSTPLPSWSVCGTTSRACTLERIDSVDDQSLPPYPGIINGNLLTVDRPSVSTVDEQEREVDRFSSTTRAAVNTIQRTPATEQITEPLDNERTSTDCDNANLEAESDDNLSGAFQTSSAGHEGSQQDTASETGSQGEIQDVTLQVHSRVVSPNELSDEIPEQHHDSSNIFRRLSSVDVDLNHHQSDNTNSDTSSRDAVQV